MLINRIIIFLILAILISSCVDNNNTESIKAQIKTLLSNTPGTYAVAFKNLSDSSQTILINEEEMFHAASTMKTAVLFELYKQEKEGIFSVSDSIEIINSFRSIVDSSIYNMDIGEDSEENLYHLIGEKASLYDLAYEMITKSSNLATNILIEKLGAYNVTNSMRSIGARDILVLRGVEDLKAYELGLSNLTNANDLMILFSLLGNYQLVDSLASINMMNILLDQQFTDIIPAKLPNDLRIAHKTGSITKVMHDSGLVILPDDEKYILILLSKDWEKEEDARELLQQISFLIYELVTS